MITRVLEPEVMAAPGEAAEYDAMNHSEVNRVFVDDLLDALGGEPADAQSAPRAYRFPINLTVLDVGTGTALIPIELCRRQEFAVRMVGVDLAEEMLALARRNVARAGLSERVRVERVDAKSMPFEDATFDVVISNSIVHHIPEPAAVVGEMLRVLRPGGLLFVRDLLRPAGEADVERIVARYAGDETAPSQQLFRQSLRAALTLVEMRDLTRNLGLNSDCVRQTSDRHWTLKWRRTGGDLPED